MATTYFEQNMVQKDVVGGLMGMPPMSDPEMLKEGKLVDPNGTPMSQASTAPCTPYFCASLPDPFGNDSDADEAWSRQSSPFADESGQNATCEMSCFLDAITEELEEVKALAEEKNLRDQTDDSEDDDNSIEWITEGNVQSVQQNGPITSVLDEKLDELKDLYHQKYGCTVDSESDDDDDLVDEDGTMWIHTVGEGPLTLHVIEEKLGEVKNLYKEKYGYDVDTESGDEDGVLDADGTTWIHTVGTGALTLSGLKEKLDEVKKLYKAKYGCDLDAESNNDDGLVDEDGTLWIRTAGTGCPTLPALEEQLDDLKNLYKEKYGCDVDNESEDENDLVDEDGTMWMCTVGAGPLTMSVLEGKLDDVKILYTEKYGHDLDIGSDDGNVILDEDGTTWMCTVGAGIVDEDGTTWRCTAGEGPRTMSTLEFKLDDVKYLYRQKYGCDVDSESDDENGIVDEDGTTWVCTVGTGPLTMSMLDEKLDDLKSLYKEKYGCDVDSEADEDDAPLSMSMLEEKLDDVKCLYKQKYGCDLDIESDEDGVVDDDGTTWMCTVGSGPLTMSVLEEKLDDVKLLFKERYGCELHSESDDEDGIVDEDGTTWMCTSGAGIVDEDGTTWRCTAGEGPRTMSTLEFKLDDVKYLYRQKYGCDVDSESDDENGIVDEDGTAWVCTVGTGPLTMSMLDEKLDDLKSLYREKYGCDVDSESDEDDAPLSMSMLEEKLDDVKYLYKEKYGCDLDIESDEDGIVDEDGTTWMCTVGSGPLTMSVLEAKLDYVKVLFKDRYGCELDSESDEEDDIVDEDGTTWMCTLGVGILDEDGTTWRCTVGEGLRTTTTLEVKLDDIKYLYRQKYGSDVDSESGDEDGIVDEDGTTWLCTVGTGPLTMSALTEKLVYLKSLYREKYGCDIDSESDEDDVRLSVSMLEEKLDDVKYLYKEKYGCDLDSESDEDGFVDEDGTMWMRTVGSGPLTMSVLEEKLDDVKVLFKERYGCEVDSESDEENDLVDEDGTTWICTPGAGILDEDGTTWRCTVGDGPRTISTLEFKLEDVKYLYRQKYGCVVDSESEDEDDVKNLHTQKYGEAVDSESDEADMVDASGSTQTYHACTALLTMSVLEERLDEVKAFYKTKFGIDVNSESDDEDAASTTDTHCAGHW